MDELDAIVHATRRGVEHHRVFAVHADVIAPPFLLRFDELSSQPRSVEAILREKLENCYTGLGVRRAPSETYEISPPNVPPAPDAGLNPSTTQSSAASLRARYGLRAMNEDLPDHLSLLARWFYSKPREGEIFFRDPDWPYRRLLRACARILAPPTPPADTSVQPSKPT